MKRLTYRIIAYILAAAIILQGSEIGNFRYMKEVFATETGEQQTTTQTDSTQINTAQEKTAQTQTTQLTTSEETTEAKISASENNQNIVEEEQIQNKLDVEAFDLFVEGGIADGNYSISRPSKLTCDLTIKGDLSIYSTLYLNGYTLTVEGNAFQYADLTVDGEMSVGGEYTWRDGNLLFHNHRLSILGKFNVLVNNNQTLSMKNENDCLFVGGDFNLDYTSKMVSDIDNGIIELQGNFVQNMRFTGYYEEYMENNFITTGNNKLLLSGNKQQVIYLSKETSGFANVEVSTVGKETEGGYNFDQQKVSFSRYFNCENYISNGCPTNYGYMEIDQQELTEDTYVYGNGYINESKLVLGKYTLYVQGDLIQNNDLVLNGGALVVLGDYRVQSVINNEQGKEYSVTAAVVDSTKNCTVSVYGDFITESVTAHTDYLSNGSWHFYGDFYQLGISATNFATSGTWTGVFEARKKEKEDTNRQLFFDNPKGNPINTLNAYCYRNTINCENGIYLNKAYSGTVTMNGIAYIDENNATAMNGMRCNICIFGDIGISYTAYVYSDVIVESSLILNKGSRLTCNNITVKSGSLEIAGGRLSAGDIVFTEEGTGTLSMEDTDSAIDCKNFTMASNAVSGSLTAGTINITGDFTQKNTGIANNLTTLEKLNIVLKGSNAVQTIRFDSLESELENVYIRNTNGGHVIFDTEVTIHNLYDESHSVIENGIVGYTLEKDMTYSDSMQMCGENLDLNGHTLTFEKDFVLAAGTVKINGGRLIVKGDFHCQNKYTEDEIIKYESTYGNILMSNEDDVLNVYGDWTIQSKSVQFNQMTKGTINLYGNIQYINEISYTNTNVQFIGGANLNMLGYEQQHIYYEKSLVTMYVNNLDVQNANGLLADMKCCINGSLNDTSNSKSNYQNIRIFNISAIKPEKINANITVFSKGKLEHDLNIEGKLIAYGEIDLNEYSLKATQINVQKTSGYIIENEKKYLKNGCININAGQLLSDDLFMNGPIYMNDKDDKVIVKNMYVDLQTDESDYMTDGTIYISKLFKTSADTYGFLPSGQHTIVFENERLDVTNKATLIFEERRSKINILILKNKLECFELNREKEEIANTFILDYEDNELPSVPEKMSCLKSGCCYVHIGWESSKDNIEIYKYKIYRDGKYIGSSKTTDYCDTVLNCDTTYRYTVISVDGKGNESEYSKELVVKTAADDEKPYNNKEPEFYVDDKKISIDMEASFYDKDTYVDYYIITRNGEFITNVIENSTLNFVNANNLRQTIHIHSGSPIYIDEDVEIGKTYTYGISAVDKDGNVSEEYLKSIKVEELPKPPADFKLTTENGYNYISFMKSGLSECSYYLLYRKSSSSSSYKKIAFIDNDAEGIYNYEDKDVTVGTTYNYYIEPYSSYSVLGTPTDANSIQTLAESIPPVITEINYSYEGDIVNEGLSFYVNAEDNGKIAKISAYYEKTDKSEKGDLFGSAIEYNGRTAYSLFYFNVDALKGDYIIHIEVVDGSGNVVEAQREVHINTLGLAPVNIISKSATSSAVSLEWEGVENASHYEVEKEMDGKYYFCKMTSGKYATITGLSSEKVYKFRVVAYDKEGIRGQVSEPVEVVTDLDKEKPQIVKVYNDKKILSAKDSLEVTYSDNIGVKKVKVAYRKLGTQEWIDIPDTECVGPGGIAYVSWEKSSLASGTYEVKYLAEDSSGNLSDEVVGKYELDVHAPEISNFNLISKDWQILVKWDAFKEEDFSVWKLYRKMEIGKKIVASGDNNTTSFEEVISPNKEETYMLYVYDTLGNESVAEISGRAIDNDIFVPDVVDISDMFAAQDTVLSLSAQGSTDNDGIKSYQWDMGNGDIIVGKNCEYVYKAVGTYKVTLTVTDNSGNQTVKTADVVIGTDIGSVDVSVVRNGKPVSNADVVVCLNDRPFHSGSNTQTDNQGKIHFPMSEGKYKIAAYKSGYTPQETDVVVNKGKETKVVIELKKEEFVEARFETKKMSYSEMVEAGIDVNKNKVAYEYSFNMKFESGKIERVNINSSQRYVSYSGATYAPSYRIENISDDPEQPIITVIKTQQVEISWLENLYEVEFTIYNKATKSFYLENCNATLDLPDKMHMADMEKDKTNKKTWNIGKLEGGTEKSHSWYVGGKENGSYKLKVDFEGELQPFDKKISKTLEAKDNLIVSIGNGLHLFIYPENSAYIGEEYYIQYKLKNESCNDYYNVTTSFGAYETVNAAAQLVTIHGTGEDESIDTISTDTGVSYYVENADGMDKYVTLKPNDKFTVNTLKSGQAIYGTCKFQFNASGDINRMYYRLIDTYADKIEKNMTNVKVTVMPKRGHLIKKYMRYKFNKKKVLSQSEQQEKNKAAAEQARIDGARKSKQEANSLTDEEIAELDKIAHPEAEQTSTDVEDPIDLMTGAFKVNHTVASVKGASNMTFDLSYNSLLTEEKGDIGIGWSHKFETKK